MTRTAQLLRDELLCIEHLVDCLDALVAGGRERGRLDEMAAVELLFLLESFADGQHPRKVEQVLLPQLLRSAGPDDEGVIRGLLANHADDQLRLRSLGAALRAAVRAEHPDLEEVAAAARVYVAHHRDHLRRMHDQILGIVERILLPETDAEVVDGFSHHDALGSDPAGVFEQARALCRRLGVPLRSSSEAERRDGA